MTFDLNADQQEAASTLDRDVVVTAGAGSGKTRMLTQRFIKAVIPGRVDGWQPASVDEIVAITFTDKAAGELAERVRITLRDEGCVEEARKVDSAWVSTIHGLCSRLLRRHAFEAEVDPQFSVADTVVVGRMRAEAFERIAVTLIGSDADVAGLFDAYSYDRVFSAVVSVTRELAVRGLAPTDVELESPVPAAVLAKNALELFSDGRSACEDYSGSAKSPGEFTEACARLAERILDLQESERDEESMLVELAAIVGDYKPLRKVTGYEEVREDGRERGDILKGQVSIGLLAPFARGLMRLVEGYSAEFARRKRDAGVLDFDDLQVGAVELLEREPGLAERYRDRFRLVMIDEFQDTDALQLRLVEALSRGNLCTVGDEKQSIYRFRGADIEVYRKHREAMAARDALRVSLGVNYRSHEDVLAFVNAVFSSDEYFADDLLRLTAPEGGRPAQAIDAALGGRPRVEALFVDCSAVRAAEGRRAEAQEIASRLATLHEAGIDPGEMVILVRAYTSAHVYAEALTDAGIPAVIVGGSRFFELEEVAVMRALTRAVANPADGSALGELLASEFCPISDNGLARLRLTADGRDGRPLWTALCEGAETLKGDDGDAALGLVRLIETARRDAGRRPLSDLLLQAVEDACYDLRLLSRGNAGRDAFANVLKFARQAAAFEATVGTGPAGFSAYLDAKERLRDVEAPASVADDGTSAVRIMSVHASKGLEFPVVVVPDLASTGRGNSEIVRIGVDENRLRLAMVPPVYDDADKMPKSLWATELGDAEVRADADEANRVLYVAFTRARDLLIASGSMNMRPKGTSTASHHLIRLARLFGVVVPISGTGDTTATLADRSTGTEVTCRVTVLDAEATLPNSSAGASAQPAAPCAAAPAPGLRFATGSEGVVPPGHVSYSSLRVFEECPRRFLVEHVLQLSNIEILEEGAADPARFGTATHAALQLVAMDGSLPSDDRVAAIGRQFELDEPQLRRLIAGLERFVTSPTAARVAAHHRVSREMPFALPIATGASALVGSIDVYARSGAGALVLDYKSGTSGSAGELETRYRLQAECYALAAFADGCESVEVVFVRPEVLEPDGALQEVAYRFDSADEPRLRDAVESRYERITTSAYEPLSARVESICGSCAAPVGLCPNARP